MNQELILIDQPRLLKGLDESSTSFDEDILTGLLFQLGNLLYDITLNDRGVIPLRLQRLGSDNVLRHTVLVIGNPVFVSLLIRPVPRLYVISRPSKKKGIRC